jgi:hypothetical protein
MRQPFPMSGLTEQGKKPGNIPLQTVENNPSALLLERSNRIGGDD